MACSSEKLYLGTGLFSFVFRSWVGKKVWKRELCMTMTVGMRREEKRCSAGKEHGRSLRAV